MFHKVEMRSEDHKIIITLYADTLTEFSAEFGTLPVEKSLIEKARNYVKKQYPSIKTATITIVLGSSLSLSIPYENSSYAHEMEYSMTYVAGSTSTTRVEATLGNVNTVAPSYFDINPDGSLKVTTILNSSFISSMHEKGVRVVPFLCNHWSREIGRAALANRENLTTQIATAVEKYQLDGVNVDIENVTAVDREAYTDFVRLLREKLPPEKEVSVAVAANPKNWTTGWHGSYDYKQLANYSDYLFIMAYDEHYPNGTPGPVASAPWVEKSVTYALGQGVSKEKIVLGLPFFGRVWKPAGLSSSTDPFKQGMGLSLQQVNSLILKYNGAISYDPVMKSPKAIITIPSDSIVTYSQGKLTPGTYEIWFENEASLQAKFEIAHQYEIKGVGSWSLGQETSNIWVPYGDWMSHQGQATIAPPSAPPQGDSPILTTPEPKVFKNYLIADEYQVESGDTLSKISTLYGANLEDIQKANSLPNDIIQKGQVLRIPFPLQSFYKSQRGPVGEIGYVTVKKPIVLWKRDSKSKLTAARTLLPGQRFRVYTTDERYGGQFGVGGGYWVTNMNGYVSYDPFGYTAPVVKGPRGEIGYVTVKKKINLWYRNANNRLQYARTLNPGSTFRAYSFDTRYGGQYSLGGNHWVTNMKGYIEFKPYQ